MRKIAVVAADGERSGKYLLGGEELKLNERGESIISYADYAIAMVDEIPVNVIIGTLTLKELFDLSNDEVVENLLLDPRYQVALFI